MADKVEKAKKSKAKPKKDQKGVLAALPATRPERIGTRRVSAPKTFEEPPAASTRKAKPAANKPAAARAKPAAAKRSPARAAKPAAARKPATTATATRRKAAAPRTFEPTEAAEVAAGAADERAAGAAVPPPPRIPPEPRPRPVREGAPGMGTTSGAREEPPSPEHGRPGGVELVATAVKAAGELTQVGLAIGGRIIKRAVDRLPKP